MVLSEFVSPNHSGETKFLGLAAVVSMIAFIVGCYLTLKRQDDENRKSAGKKRLAEESVRTNAKNKEDLTELKPSTSFEFEESAVETSRATAQTKEGPKKKGRETMEASRRKSSKVKKKSLEEEGEEKVEVRLGSYEL